VFLCDSRSLWARFDAFLTQFNHERPHQALDMRLPGELYVRSPRPYTGLAPLAGEIPLRPQRLGEVVHRRSGVPTGNRSFFEKENTLSK
jgi:hypothetical protein